MGWFQIISAIISIVLALFTAGHGQRLMAGDGGAMDMGVAAGAGAGAAFFAWMAGAWQLIQRLIVKPTPGPVDPNVPVDPTVPVNLPTNLPLELMQAVQALIALAADRSNWILQKAFIIQSLEAVYVVIAATVKSPALLEIIKQAMTLAETEFAAQAPKTALGTVKPVVTGLPTVEQWIEG